MYLATLAEAVGKTGWRVHAYVLTGNHYHLVLETPEANLVRGMAWKQTTYTARYNARHRTLDNGVSAEHPYWKMDDFKDMGPINPQDTEWWPYRSFS